MTSIVPLRVYVYKDGLARFTTQPYREPTATNVGNVFLHLTNYAIQKHSEKFIREDEEAGTKRRVTTVNCWFIEHGYDVDKVMSIFCHYHFMNLERGFVRRNLSIR